MLGVFREVRMTNAWCLEGGIVRGRLKSQGQNEQSLTGNIASLNIILRITETY